jgi:cob(I)alamin adenosyltransferase
MKLKKGYVQVYTGSGKGKTTASMGLALRASGHGMKTMMIQFMKGDTTYGEICAIREKVPEITVKQFGTPDLICPGKCRDIDYEEAEKAYKEAEKALENPDISILILDEINVALLFGLLKVEDVLKLIDKKPEHLELILTGRGAPQELIDRADLVTKMECVKHYYDTQKVESRNGIEH